MAWTVDGNSEDRLLRLAFNEPSGVLLAHFERVLHQRHVIRSLYVRRVQDAEGGEPDPEYRALRAGTPGVSIHSFASPDDAPFVFVEELAAADEALPASGWNTRAIARISLETGRADVVLEQAMFETEDLRIGQIVGCGASHDSVQCYVYSGRTSAHGAGAHVGTICMSTRRITKMIRLLNNHF
jgi:hypothetical protein